MGFIQVLSRYFKENGPKRDPNPQKIETRGQLLNCVQFF